MEKLTMGFSALADRPIRRFVCGLGGLILVAMASSVYADDAALTVPWAKDLDSALGLAKQKEAKANGLVVVVVSEGQCTYCEWMDERIFNQPPVVEAAHRFVFVREKVGLDETGVIHDSAFAKERKSEFTPTFYILDGSGELIDRFWGVNTPEEFVERLKQSEDHFRNFPELAKRLEKDPEDVSAVGLYAAALTARGKRDEAIALVKKAEGGTPKAELAPAYNRLGDSYFQGLPGAMCELYGSFSEYDNGADDAAGWFQKTVESSEDPALVAHARFGLSMCFQAQKKPAEMAAQHDAILAMPDAPKNIVERVKSFK